MIKNTQRFNHNLDSITTNFVSRTGSRNRVRIPVQGTRFTGVIKPGDRVRVAFNNGDVLIQKTKGNKRPGTYKVEKDGAIRIPAHLYSLKSKRIEIKCDKVSGAFLLFNSR